MLSKLDKNKKIQFPEVNLPKEVVPALKKLVDYVKDGATKNPEWMESWEGIPLEKLPSSIDSRFSIFRLVCEANEIIENLNLIMSDFYDLTKTKTPFFGRPKARLYLLMKSFYHELYRTKEILAIFLKDMRRLKKIHKKEMRDIKKMLNEIIDMGLTIRNKLVHQRLCWPGKANLDLILLEACEDAELKLIEKDSGKEVSIDVSLENFYNDWILFLATEGYKLSDLLQTTTDYFSTVIVQEGSNNQATV